MVVYFQHRRKKKITKVTQAAAAMVVNVMRFEGEDEKTLKLLDVPANDVNNEFFSVPPLSLFSPIFVRSDDLISSIVCLNSECATSK